MKPCLFQNTLFTNYNKEPTAHFFYLPAHHYYSRVKRKHQPSTEIVPVYVLDRQAKQNNSTSDSPSATRTSSPPASAVRKKTNQIPAIRRNHCFKADSSYRSLCGVAAQCCFRSRLKRKLTAASSCLKPPTPPPFLTPQLQRPFSTLLPRPTQRPSAPA